MNEKFNKTKLTLAISLLCCSANIYAAAQVEPEVDPEDDVEVITVSSTKRSLIKALDIKRQSDSIVDGITASELGVFPDANVADSLSHITGVTIDRTSGGEGQGVSIRGLGPEFSIVTINNRIMATDSSSRDFAFDVLPSSVISEAWVHKSVTASQLEGSIGGAINLKTARPFDNPGTHGSFGAEGIYGEQADKFGYKLTSVGSHTFNDNTMGILVSALYSRAPTRTDELSDNWWEPSTSTNWSWDRNGDGLTNDPADDELIFPGTIAYTAREENKERTAVSAAFQYRPNNDLDIVIDALWTRLDTPSKGYTESYFFPDVIASGSDATYGGIKTELNPLGTLVTGITVQNLVPQLVTLEEHRVVDTVNLGANFTYNVTDNSVLTGDIYMSTATREAGGKDRFVVSVPVVAGETTARMELTDGGLPSITLDFADNEGGITQVSDIVGNGQFGPHFTRLEGIDIDDQVIGASLGHEIFLDMAVLDSVEYGVVYNKRTKDREQYDNRANMSLYSGAPFTWDDVDADVVQAFPFDNFLDGVSGDFPREFTVFDVAKAFEAIKSADGNPNVINPLTGEPYVAGYSDALFPVFNSNLSGSVEEETVSLYAQSNFSLELDNMNISGNIGLRYVQTDVTSSGYDSPILSVSEAPQTIWASVVDYGPTVAIEIENDYDELLPSMNLQFEFSEELVVRLSYAEVMSRPGIDQLSTQVDHDSLTYNQWYITKIGDPGLSPVTAEQADLSIEWYYKEGSSVSAAIFQKDIRGFVQSGIDLFEANPEEKPTYLVENPIRWAPSGTYEEVAFTIAGPRNLDQAKILGYEFALQHFFDSGFGIVSNYTYIDTESIVSGFSVGVLENIPDTSYSLSLMYNSDKMSLNLSAYHTESFVTSHWSPLNVFAEDGSVTDTYKGKADPTTWSSASATFYVAEGLEVYAQLDNLLDEGWHGYNGTTDLPGSYAEWGRTAKAGVRYKF
ncbi:TonB-dependent receptor [Paraglaciecola arctica]|uniref:TonB-dependent receptor n=1 Tax=Paraglaciecola arctica TaxID=1128911 RepID=UPI001C073E52|nr:TonB-dependent receptor [Paraglaciecola arctica]MBU3005926.1 TonB-dependent receptor [Paraglaciecola arctica]